MSQPTLKSTETKTPFIPVQFSYSSYQQDPRVLPNSYVVDIVNNFDHHYQLIKKWTEGLIYLGVPEGDVAMMENKTIVCLSKGFSAPLFDMLLKQKFADTCRSSSPMYLDGPMPTLPVELVNPPPIDPTKIRYNDALGTYTPIERKWGYLVNFKVNWKGTRIPFKKVKNDANSIVTYAYAKMFHDQIRPRGLSPLQAFVVAMLGYRCNSCVVNFDSGCHCYLHSPAINMCVQMTKTGRGIPFHINVKDSQCVKLESYDYISSLTPTLWYAMLELSLRTGLGAIDEAAERTCVYLWTEACRTVLFGESLGALKKLKGFEPLILSRTNLYNVAISRENAFTSYSRTGPIGSFDQVKWTALIEKFGLESYIAPTLKPMGNKTGRWVYAIVNQLYVLPMTVKAPISLSLAISARGTQQQAPMVQKEVQWVQLGAEWVPIRFAYDDPDLNAIRAKILDNLQTAKPDLSKLEYGFIEASTTNSAGLDKSALEEIKAALRSLLGNTPEVEEYLEFLNMRIFDVIRVIKDVYKTTDATLSDWNRDRMTGVRDQVGRRNRLIQMLASVYMGPAYIMKTLLESVMDQVPYGAGGKTTNDIRDMHLTMYGTGRPLWLNSLDVVGMDTNTLPPVRRYVSEAASIYLEQQRQFNYPFFMNKSGSETLPIRVMMRKKGVDDQLIEYYEEVSVLEYMLFLDMKTITSRSIINDTLFGTHPSASNFAFESGSFKTSSQHNVINSKILERVNELISEEFSHICAKVEGSVLGDDHISAATCPFLMDIEHVARRCSDELRRLFALFGYETEDGLNYKVAEFLKLIAIAGMPSMLFSRLAVFTSERGEDYSRSTVGRLKNELSILIEMTARVPRQQHAVVLQRLCAMALSYSTLYTSKGEAKVGRYIHPTQRGFRKLAKEKKGTMRVKDVVSHNEVISWEKKIFGWETETVNLYIFPGVWYIIPTIGVAPYPYVNGDNVEPGGSYLSFPSPATMRRILSMCAASPLELETIQNESYSKLVSMGFSSWRASNPGPVRRFIDSQCAKSTIKTYHAELIAAPHAIPISADSKFSMPLGLRYGIVQGYHIIKMLTSQQVDFEPGPVFKNAMRIGDTYLDPAKSFRSARAQMELLDTFGFSVPELQTYKKRVSARMTSAATQRTEPMSLDIGTIKLFDSLGQDLPLPGKLRDDLTYGDYTLQTSKITEEAYGVVPIYEVTGFGSAVEKGTLAALMVDILGLPPMSAVSQEALKESIAKEMLIPGAADDVLRTLGRAYRKGGEAALKLGFEAVGVPERSRPKIIELFKRLGTEFSFFPYALNPRQMFCLNTNTANIPSRFYSDSASPMRSKTQRAIFMSEIMMSPNVLKGFTRLQLGASLMFATV